MFGFWSRCQGKCRGDAPDEWDWSQPRGRISSISGEPSGEPISGEPAARNLPTDELGRILDSAGIPFQIPRPPPFEEGWGGVTREEYDERVRRCVLLCTPEYPNVPPPAVYQQVEGYGVYAGVYQQGGYEQQGGSAQQGQPQLPYPWEQLADQNGQVYYSNPQTGEASWDPPQ